MNDTTMTIVGNVVDSPKLRRTRNGHCVANFRVASTPRRFDREKSAWVDCPTLFVAVSAWRALGENAAQSLRKGMPVVVTGRYFQREYEKNETLRTTYELEASAVGPDLNRGVATFERVTRAVGVVEIDLDENGIPADHSEDYLDLLDDDDEPPAEVDPLTGEVRQLAPAS
jgi:single-strand DNA-binding protein